MTAKEKAEELISIFKSKELALRCILEISNSIDMKIGLVNYLRIINYWEDVTEYITKYAK